AQHLEQRVRQQPLALALHERGERAPLVAARGVAERSIGRGRRGLHGVERHTLRERVELREPIRVEQPRVAGERGAQRVRRAVQIRQTERQRLPHAEAAVDEPVDEAQRVVAERAGGPGSGQRRRMQQDAGAAPCENVAHRPGPAARAPPSMSAVTSTTPCSVTWKRRRSASRSLPITVPSGTIVSSSRIARSMWQSRPIDTFGSTTERYTSERSATRTLNDSSDSRTVA